MLRAQLSGGFALLLRACLLLLLGGSCSFYWACCTVGRNNLPIIAYYGASTAYYGKADCGLLLKIFI